MNAERRKALNSVQDQLTKLQEELNAFLSDWHERATTVRDELDGLKEEEDEYRGNMEEKFSNTERYSTAESNVEALDTAVSEMDEKLGELEAFVTDDTPFSSVFDSIEEAKGA